MNSRGVSIVEVLVATTIAAGSVAALMAHSNAQYAATMQINRKVTAQNYAADLVEIFQSMSPTEFKNYMNRNPATGAVGSNLYTFCTPANFDSLNPGGVPIEFPNPIAALPADHTLGSPLANRSYVIQVVDMKTLAVNSSACGKDINGVALSADEMFMLGVKVAWGEGREKEVEVNAVLPREAIASNVGGGGTPPIPTPPPGPAVDPCDRQNSLGLLTFETWPNGTATADQNKVTNQYIKSHGITFCIDEKKNGTCNGKSTPEIAKVGGNKTAFNCKTSGCSTTNDGIRNLPGKDFRKLAGQSFLKADTYPMLVDYQVPVSQASGYVIDIADSTLVEVVKIVPLGEKGKPIAGATVTIREGDPDTGDGVPTFWEIRRPSADIHAIRFEFNDGGFALDAFSPIKACTPL